MAYPKLSAALDELLSKLVIENGEAALTFFIENAVAKKAEPAPPPVEVKEGDRSGD